MSDSIASFSREYQRALLTHLNRRGPLCLLRARTLGCGVLTCGIATVELVKLHEKTLLGLLSQKRTAVQRSGMVRRAGSFLARVVTSLSTPRPGDARAATQLPKLIQSLSHRTLQLASLNLDLSREVTFRKSVEASLKKSERHYAQSLSRSNRLQEELRQLSRRVLSSQEEERKRISRELHDVIAQTLTAINIRLAALKREAVSDAAGLTQNIERTQRLVEQSVSIVHQFARELRPAVLDDLGLTPALSTVLKQFTVRTGIPSRFVSCPAADGLDASRRTVLFRVAQEALTNIDRHAHAKEVQLKLTSNGIEIHMQVIDDGRSFQVNQALQTTGAGGLGLLGMRERLEMVRGRFLVTSQPKRGTTVSAWIPLKRGASRSRRSNHSTSPKPE